MSQTIEALSLAALMRTPRAELEALYRQTQPGPIPDGPSRGAATIAPGTSAGRRSERFFSIFWAGKIFNRADGSLINDTLIGKTVKAKVYVAESWFDGAPAIIIDYKTVGLKQMAWLAAPVRDEIRLVSPSLYLGFAYLRNPVGAPAAPLMFALDFSR